MINKYRKAFTLVEVMIVTGIIALVLAVALPNYFSMIAKANKYTCIVNMYQIDGALSAWAIDNGIAKGKSVSADQETDIYAYIQGGIPRCPANGTYSIHQIGIFPQVTCSREDLGHMMEEIGPGVKPEGTKPVSAVPQKAEDVSSEAVAVQKVDAVNGNR
jgi:prepilin-type N-terminal cleavage/methylation domain-containing protein